MLEKLKYKRKKKYIINNKEIFYIDRRENMGYSKNMVNMRN